MTMLPMLASEHLRCAVLVLAAMVLAIAAGCEGEPEVVEVGVVENVEVHPSSELESWKAAVRESDATSERSESFPASSAPDPTIAAQKLTPYPTLTPIQVQEVPDHGENIGPDLVRQTPDDTSIPDDAILAAETGLPIERIASAMASQESFGEHAHEPIRQFPDQISAVWMDSPPGTEGPNTRGNIRFTGAIPTDIKTMDNVVLTGDGLISMADHKRRAEVAATALSDLGYNNFLTYFDPRENVIHIELLLPEGAMQPSKSDIISAVRQHIGRDLKLQGRAAQVEAIDLELTVLRGPGPFLILH